MLNNGRPDDDNSSNCCCDCWNNCCASCNNRVQAINSAANVEEPETVPNPLATAANAAAAQTKARHANKSVVTGLVMAMDRDKGGDVKHGSAGAGTTEVDALPFATTHSAAGDVTNLNFTLGGISFATTAHGTSRQYKGAKGTTRGDLPLQKVTTASTAAAMLEQSRMIAPPPFKPRVAPSSPASATSDNKLGSAASPPTSYASAAAKLGGGSNSAPIAITSPPVSTSGSAGTSIKRGKLPPLPGANQALRQLQATTVSGVGAGGAAPLFDARKPLPSKGGSAATGAQVVPTTLGSSNNLGMMG